MHSLEKSVDCTAFIERDIPNQDTHLLAKFKCFWKALGTIIVESILHRERGPT